MSVTYIYSKVHKVPVLVAWKCSKCHCANASKGEIAYAVGARSSSNSRATQKEINRELGNALDGGWLSHALGMMRNPTAYYKEIRNDLILENCKCRKCGHKEVWSIKKHNWVSMPFLIGFMIAIIRAAAAPESIEAWIIAAVFLGLHLLSALSDKIIGMLLKKTPGPSLPKILTKNAELIQYAEDREYTVFNEEAMTILAEASSGAK